MNWRVRNGGFLIVLVLEVAGQARAQSFKILVPSHSRASCAGCTNGGLACFALNSCEAGCLDQIRISCTSCAATGTSSCCPSCPNPCTANFPCAGKTPFIVVADTCPTDPSATAGCQYYARRSKCLDGRCIYYSTEAPRRCKDPPAHD
jgi:hypothetical protein